MTTTERSLGPTSTVDAALRAADPASPYLCTPQVEQALDALGVLIVASDPSTEAADVRQKPQRRRVTFVTGLTAFSLAAVGGGAAVAGGVTTHTGMWWFDGGPVKSEVLQPGAPDFLPYARKITADTQFPPGDSAENYWWTFLMKNDDGSFTQHTAVGVKSSIADDASCAWQRVWLKAHDAGDAQAMTTASTAIHQAARSDDLRNNNNASYTEHLIDAADAGDTGPLETSLRMACPSPKPLAP